MRQEPIIEPFQTPATSLDESFVQTCVFESPKPVTHRHRGRTGVPVHICLGPSLGETEMFLQMLHAGFVCVTAGLETKIDKNTTYDFVTTNDIIGGNSGSPVIDRAGTVIGAAFDGNIHSLGGNYGYDGTLNRTVAVSAAAVQEALETIYPAPALVEELARR